MSMAGDFFAGMRLHWPHARLRSRSHEAQPYLPMAQGPEAPQEDDVADVSAHGLMRGGAAPFSYDETSAIEGDAGSVPAALARRKALLAMLGAAALVALSLLATALHRRSSLSLMYASGVTQATQLRQCGSMQDGMDLSTQASLYQVFPIRGAEECRRQCEKDRRCGAWTWGKARGVISLTDVCFLKALGLHEQPEVWRNTKLVAGVVCRSSADDAATPAASASSRDEGTNSPGIGDCGAIEDDADYWTNVPLFRIEPVMSAKACRSKCEATESCSVWTWGKPGGLISLDAACFLKGLLPDETPRRHSIKGVMSGISCPGDKERHAGSGSQEMAAFQPTDPAGCGTHEEGVAYSGTDKLVDLYDIADAMLCGRYCKGHPGCLSWSWLPARDALAWEGDGPSSVCTLLAEATPHKKISPTAISGLTCHSHEDFSQAAGPSASGAPKDATGVTTSAAPHPAATSTPEPTASTTSRPTSVTTTTASSTVSPTTTTATTSLSTSTSSTTSVPQMSEAQAQALTLQMCQVLEYDTDFRTQTALPNLPGITSAGLCQQKCTDNGACGGWSWGAARNVVGMSDVCFMKSLAPGQEPTRLAKVGVISGLPCRIESWRPRFHEATTTTGFPDKFPPGSLFCFSLVVLSGYESGLVKMQFSKRVSIFDCDEYAVYSNEVVKLVEGLVTRKVNSDLKCDYGGEFKTALNLNIFFSVWEKVVVEGRFRLHDWTVKTDPDCVFFPGRLRRLLPAHTSGPQGVYLNNCKMGLHGPIEVFSNRAVETWWAGKDRCKQHFWKLCSGDCFWGEDLFIDQCLSKVLHVKRDDEESLLVEDHCAPPPGWTSCKNSTVAAFHPFKSVEDYGRCLEGTGVSVQGMPFT